MPETQQQTFPVFLISFGMSEDFSLSSSKSLFRLQGAIKILDDFLCSGRTIDFIDLILLKIWKGAGVILEAYSQAPIPPAFSK